MLADVGLVVLTAVGVRDVVTEPEVSIVGNLVERHTQLSVCLGPAEHALDARMGYLVQVVVIPQIVAVIVTEIERGGSAVEETAGLEGYGVAE